MTKLKIVIGELELDVTGTQAEVSKALKDFMAGIEAAIAPRQREGNSEPPDEALKGTG